MSNYSQTTFFTPKDSLPPSNPAKTIFGAAYDVEFGNISTAIASKYDSTSIAAGPIAFGLGSAAAPSVTFLGETGTGLYSNGSGDLGLATAGTARLVISGANGGAIVGAATGGSQGTGTLNAVGLFVNGTAVSLAGATVTSLTGTANQVAVSASTGTVTLSLPQNVIIPTPASGIALAVTGVSGANALSIAASGGGNAISASSGAANAATYSFSTNGGAGMWSSAANNVDITTGSTNRINVNANGNVTINAPGSGNTFQATAVSTNAAIRGTATTAGSNSFLASPGTAGGAAYAFDNAGNAGMYSSSAGRLDFATGGSLAFSVDTSQGIFTAGATGSGQGSGTINATGLFVNAGPVYSGIPQNSQSAAYVTVLSDANKHIYHPTSDNNARTFTIAANASVAYPIGTAITFDNDINTVTIAINSDTLVWLPSGATGSRTLAAQGQATALKVTATRWHLTGVGIT